jgi:hypothetical protein
MDLHRRVPVHCATRLTARLVALAASTAAPRPRTLHAARALTATIKDTAIGSHAPR